MNPLRTHGFATATIVAALFATQTTQARRVPPTYPTLGEAIADVSFASRAEVGDGVVQVPPAFTQSAYLKASNTAANDRFGFSVAMSGDTAVVGAPFQSTDAAGNGGAAFGSSGAAYVFVRTRTADGEVWAQQGFLKAENADVADNFGQAVAISGDTIVVGAPAAGTPTSTGNVGAAYVFVRTGTTWTQKVQLNASPLNQQAGAMFGAAVAISGDTIVVGAHQENRIGAAPSDVTAFDEGAAYVFVGAGAAWTEQAHLKARHPGQDDFFGFSVAVSGDTIVVGAHKEDSNAIGVDGDQTNDSAPLSGAAYVFRRDAEAWSQQSYLKASNTRAGDNFGYSVAISGDTVVVGARLEAGRSTGVNGDQTNNLLGQAGAAYVFVASADSWVQQAYLKASNTSLGDLFGHSVAIDRNIIVVGAPEEDSGASVVDGNQADNSLAGAGAAYVFLRTCGAWQQRAYFKPSNPGFDDSFGVAVAAAGGTVLVGAHQEDGSATIINGADNNAATEAGAAYAFSMTNTAPSITTSPISRWPGSTTTNRAIADVDDAEEGKCSLDVRVQSANPSNGVTVSGLTNAAGTVTANLDVAPGATSASFTLRVTDLAGAFTERAFEVTVVPPVTIAPNVTPAANVNGWHNGSVQVTWSVANSTFELGCGPTDLVAETPAGGATLTCTAGNAGDTTSSSVTVKIDKTAPAGTVSRWPLANGNGWVNTDITLTFECTDPLSGPVTATSSTIVTTQGFNQSRSFNCLDLAGNSRTVSITGLNIDKTPPTVTPTSVTAAPNPATVGSPIKVTATLIDTGFSNLSRAEFSIGGTTFPLPAANTSATLTADIGSFAADGVMTVCVRGFDRADNQGADACAPITVFDPSVGVPVLPGDVVVVDPDGGSLNANKGILFRVDPDTGKRLMFTDFGVENTGGQDPRWIAIDRVGRILLVDQTAGTGGWGALIRVDPRTTDPVTHRPRVEVVSDFGNETAGNLPAGSPQGVAVEADGNILVVDAGAATAPPTTPRPPRLFRVNPETGARTVVSTLPSGFPTAIGIERDGGIVVLDQAGNPRLLRINPATGAQTVVTVLNQGADPSNAPRGIAVEADGSLLVVDIAGGTNQRGVLFRVSAVDGKRVRISDFGDGQQGPLAENPQQVTVAADRRIFVTDQFIGTGGAGALFRVDPASGDRVLLTDFGDAAPGGVNPFGVAIIPAPPGVLKVIKRVLNDNGGTHTAADWTMTVSGGRPAPASFSGEVSPGSTVLIDAGPYSVAELGPDGYRSTPSAECSGTIASGETKTCTITSDDLPATLIVIKNVVNDNGGTAGPGAWTMTVDAIDASPASFPGQAGTGTVVTLNPGTYSVTESEPTGYSNVLSLECSGTLAAGETRTCTATSDDKPATLVVIKQVTNDAGGTAVPGDWIFSVSGTNASPATFHGIVAPGTEVHLDAGAYEVVDGGPAGYVTTRSTGCSGNVDIGDVRTCTSISDDQDLTPPDTTITSAPPASTTSTNAAFAFSATETGTFGCSLDGVAFVSCTSPTTYTTLTVGSHTFAVRAIDAAGNVDPTPASYSWTVTPVLVTLAVTKAGTGTGTVTSSPAGIDCGAACAASFVQGTSVTLAVRAATGSTFTAWSGAADCADGVVTMSSALSCTATFTANALPDLTVSSLMIQGPKSITAGSMLQLNSTVTNTATGIAPPSTVSFYLSSNGTFEAATDLLLGSRSVPQLATKGTSSATTAVTLPTTLAGGTWFIVAVADSAGVVVEASETNNSLSRSFKTKK